MKLTEQIQLKKTLELSKICHLSKNLYNSANYYIRQDYFHMDYNWLRYNDLNYILRDKEVYRNLPIQTSQQILKLIDKSWKSFFNGKKKSKKVRIPNYKRKDGEYVVMFTNQQCKIKEGFIYFPKRSNLPPIKTRIKDDLHQIRIIPKGLYYVIEIIYEKKEEDLNLDKNRIIGIDLGLNNIITIVNNVGLEPTIIKGGFVKSINQFYNKQLAKYKSKKDKQGYDFETKRLQRLTRKRNNKINDIFHKISRKIINYCIKNNTGTIIIGYNEGWKQNINIGKRNNQNFVYIPFLKLIQKIQYKTELVGIDVVCINENHTSKCSFLDNEEIGHHKRYLGKRIKRGLFKSKDGILINADVNAGYNIIKKAVPNAFKVDGIDDGVGLHPYCINI